MEPQGPRQVASLQLDAGEFNPNHRYRFGAPDFDGGVRLVADLRSSAGDDSLYVAPHVQREFSLVVRNADDEEFRFAGKPDDEIRLSIHGSGVVNLRVEAERARLRHSVGAANLGRLLRFVIAPGTELKVVPTSEYFTPSVKTWSLPTVFPILGIGATGLDVYRADLSERWPVEQVADMIVDVRTTVRGRSFAYHFVFWWNPLFPKFAGDIALQV